MRITCASSLAYGTEAFGTLGEVVVRDGRGLCAADLGTTRVLAIRSTTRVDAALLAGTAVEFVGTATIGIDHIDQRYLDAQGIRWAHAAGSNANSVGEYIAAALLTLATRGWGPLEGRTLGIVGVGNVGTQVARKARALGMRVVVNDPPRARAVATGSRAADPEFPEFVALAELLAVSDAVTLHVPLTKVGADATVGLADEAFFASMRPGSVFLNSARGPVMRTDALLAALRGGRLAHAVIDTWEGEPRIRRDLLERVALGTPHLAGYSFDGKVNGTVMIYRAACEAMGVSPSWDAAACLPAALVPVIALRASGRSDAAVLHDVVRRVYAIEKDDAELRAGMAGVGDEGLAAMFDGLREHYGVRREFQFTRVQVPDGSPALAAKLAGLGFT